MRRTHTHTCVQTHAHTHAHECTDTDTHSFPKPFRIYSEWSVHCDVDMEDLKCHSRTLILNLLCPLFLPRSTPSSKIYSSTAISTGHRPHCFMSPTAPTFPAVHESPGGRQKYPLQGVHGLPTCNFGLCLFGRRRSARGPAGTDRGP